MLATLFVALQLIPVLTAVAVDEACAIDDPSCSQPEGGLSLLQVKALKVGKAAPAAKESTTTDHGPKSTTLSSPTKPPSCLNGCDGDACALGQQPLAIRKCGHECSDEDKKKMKDACKADSGPPLPQCMKGCDGNICALAQQPLDIRKCGHECSDKEKATIKDMCKADSGPPPPQCMKGCDGNLCVLAEQPLDIRKCGHECSDKEKALIKDYCKADSGPQPPPPCAASCVGQGDPTCATLDAWVGPGGCAETCDAAMKDMFRQKLCNGEGNGEGNMNNGEGNGEGNMGGTMCGTYTCGPNGIGFCGACGMNNGEGNGEGNMGEGNGEGNMNNAEIATAAVPKTEPVAAKKEEPKGAPAKEIQ